MSFSTSTTRRKRFAAVALSFPLALSLTGTALATGADQAAGKATAQGVLQAEAKPDKAEGKKTEAAQPLSTAVAPQPLSTADANGTGANPGETCTHAYCSTRDGSASRNGKGDGAATGKPCAGCVGKADNKNPNGQAPNGTDDNAGYECDRNQGIGQSNPAHTGCTTAATSPTGKPTKAPSPKPTKAPSPKPTKAPGPKPTKAPGTPGTATMTIAADCRTVVVTSSKDISNVVVTFADGTSQKFEGLSRTRWTRTFTQDVSSATAKSATTRVSAVATGCGVLPTTGPTPVVTCPDGSAMPPGGANKCRTDKGVSDNAQDKVTICHATGSATNPYVVISPSKQGVLNGHVGHQDGRDIIPPFSYVEDGVTKQFPGQNWNPATQELFGRGCTAAPAPAAQPTNPVGPATQPVCPTTPVMGPVMAGCEVPTEGGGTPIAGQPEAQPATNPVKIGPPTRVPDVVAQGAVTPLTGQATAPARARVAPSTLPFTGTDAGLLLELGALLLLGGGGLLLVVRRERTARAA